MYTYEVWLYQMNSEDESEDQPVKRVAWGFRSYDDAKAFGDNNPPKSPNLTLEIHSPDGRLMSRLAWRWE